MRWSLSSARNAEPGCMDAAHSRSFFLCARLRQGAHAKGGASSLRLPRHRAAAAAEGTHCPAVSLACGMASASPTGLHSDADESQALHGGLPASRRAPWCIAPGSRAAASWSLFLDRCTQTIAADPAARPQAAVAWLFWSVRWAAATQRPVDTPERRGRPPDPATAAAARDGLRRQQAGRRGGRGGGECRIVGRPARAGPAEQRGGAPGARRRPRRSCPPPHPRPRRCRRPPCCRSTPRAPPRQCRPLTTATSSPPSPQTRSSRSPPSRCAAAAGAAAPPASRCRRSHSALPRAPCPRAAPPCAPLARMPAGHAVRLHRLCH